MPADSGLMSRSQILRTSRRNAVLFFDYRGDHEFLPLDTVLGRARLAFPAVAIMLVGQESVQRTILTLDSVPGPTFHRRRHGGTEVHGRDAAKELLAQARPTWCGVPG